ncbi:cyclin-D4-2 [Raphanus sativus]|uniref:Cyclin-D4-2 n=1 Tax=Raphanus sativus TaxID=3726 RepID=A0A6J0KHP4_RAPSA|nr:cyclin-D4-2 [Raphanus sativus]
MMSEIERSSFDDENSISSSYGTTSILLHQVGFPFPSEEEENIREMIDRERQHSPRDDYLERLRSGDLDFNVRNQALDSILKACEELRLGPVCICLAINYLDRFLSVHDLPSGKDWAVQLLAVSCLSLATKVEETKVPELKHLQVGDPRFVFEAKHVQRMELLVLNVLKWRLRAVTPCSYVRYFLSKINGYDDRELSCRLISRVLQVIASTTRGIDFLEFRASEIGAAVALSVSGEQLHTLQFDKFSFSSFCPHLDKERVKKIGEMIERNGSASCPQTPPNNAVLRFKTLSTSSVSSSLTSLF